MSWIRQTYQLGLVLALLATKAAWSGEEDLQSPATELSSPTAADLPTIALLPVEMVDASLLRHAAEIQAVVQQALEDEPFIRLSTRREVLAAMAALNLNDYRDSRESLGRVAFAAGAAYAMYVFLHVEEDGSLLAIARVGRPPAGLVATPRVRVRWDPKRPVESARVALLELLGACRLHSLPSAW